MSDAAAREQTNTEAGNVDPGLRVPFSRRRLVKLIAAKLTLDLLFVCGLAVYTHAVTFARGFEGEIEHADGLGVRGWVVDLEGPGAVVEVQLFLDGRFAASALASEPDASQSDRRVFVFQFQQPRYGVQEARVYAVREGLGGARRTLQQIGDPRTFNQR